jgi:hypothetical protein
MKPKHGWTLYAGPYEILWKNNVAIRVRILGANFYPRSKSKRGKS